MKKKELTVLIEGLRKLSTVAAEIAASLAGGETPVNRSAVPADISEQTAEDAVPGNENTAESESSAPESAPEPPAMVYTFEEVRGILADKARAGFREEVKALLTAHGVKQLSDVKTPEEFAAIVAEAEVVGNG